MIRQIADILLTMIEADLLYYVMCKEPKKQLKRLLPTIALFFVPICFMTYLHMSPEEKFLWGVLLCTFIGVSVYGLKLTYAIVMGSLFYVCIVTGEILVQVSILFFSKQSVTVFTQNTGFFVMAVLLSKLLAWALAFLFKKLFSGLDQGLDLKFSAILVIPMLLFIYIETKLIGLILGYTDDVIVHNEIIFSFLAIVTSVCMVFSTRYMMAMKNLQISQDMNEEQLQQIYQYYKKRREHDEEIKKIYHDLNNHLTVIEKYEDETKRKKYIEYLKNELKKTSTFTRSGNDIVDIVLGDKREKYEDIQFLLLVQGDIDLLKKIDDFDLVTILGNALENAAEAIQKLNPEMRLVNMHIKIVHHFILIIIENEYMEGYSSLDKTSKENTSLHGYGIANIKEAVDKYEGLVEIDTKEQKFSLQIILPV